MNPNKWEQKIFDKPLLQWNKQQKRLVLIMNEDLCRSDQVPCENDCSKLITLGDEVIVVYTSQGKPKGLFCSVECQRQFAVQASTDRKMGKLFNKQSDEHDCEKIFNDNMLTTRDPEIAAYDTVAAVVFHKK